MKRIGNDVKNVPVFELSTNPILINTLRRTLLQNVPTFAFDPENIVVSRMKSTMFDADYLRIRIANMPVQGPTEEEFRQFIEENQDWVLNNDPEGMVSSIHGITMSCAANHTEGREEIINVTTDMCTFTREGKPIKNPYPTPILICKLRKKEAIDFAATAILNIPLRSAIFQPAHRCYFTEESDKKYHFRLASRTASLEEETLLRRAIEIIHMRIDHFLTIVGKDNTETGGKIVFPFDRFTLPQLFTDYIQEHQAVDYAGYKCDHLLGTQGTIFYRAHAPLSLIMSEVGKKIHADLDTLGGTTTKKHKSKKRV